MILQPSTWKLCHLAGNTFWWSNFKGKCNNSSNLSWIWLHTLLHSRDTGSLQLYHKLRPSSKGTPSKFMYISFMMQNHVSVLIQARVIHHDQIAACPPFLSNRLKILHHRMKKKSNNFRVHHNKMGKKVLIKGTQFSNFWNWNCSVALPSFDRVALTAKMYRIFWVARQAFFPPNHHRSFLSEIS